MIKPSFYKQYDTRWSNVKGNGATIARNGCGPTSVANIASVLVKSSITPKTVFKYMADNKYINGSVGSYWNGITATLKHFNITKFTVTSSAAEAKKSLKKGCWVLATVGPSRWTRGGHFIVVYAIENGKCKISDSASSSDYRQNNGPWSEYAAAECQQWIAINPADYNVKKAKTTKTYTLYVSDAYANVRKGRGVKYGVKGRLKRGTKLVLYSYKSGWYRIKKGSYKGYYINESVLSKYEPHIARYKLLDNMNVRKGYTTKADIIRVLAKGTTVKSSKIKGDWIYTPKYNGWICIKQGGKKYLKKLN